MNRLGNAPIQDWSEAPDVSIFYGRQAELRTIAQWVVHENCRLITLLGMGGIGKTSLSVKIVASSIHDYFDGNISYFLDTTQQGAFLFNDIRDLLHQQFQRLTELERSLMYWLAIDREPVTLPELQTDFVANIPSRDFLESLNSLQRRSLVEKSGIRFTQQPVVMEYVINQFIEQICEELLAQHIALFSSHALIKAQAKDYVRETQFGLILQPHGV